MSEQKLQTEAADGQSRLNALLGMVKDLRDEADLCRNGGVADIADLLDSAAAMLERTEATADLIMERNNAEKREYQILGRANECEKLRVVYESALRDIACSSTASFIARGAKSDAVLIWCRAHARIALAVDDDGA